MKNVSLSKYGVDVALKRADDLDKLLLTEIGENPGSKVLDIGCGAGGQSVRMAKVGATVLGVDVVDYTKEFSDLRVENDFSEEQLNFICGDVVSVFTSLAGSFDYICLQRLLHYFTYEEAKELLVRLRKVTSKKLFVSVSGLASEIGTHYIDKDKAVEQRFAEIDEDGKEKFFISEPVCLYTKEEFEKLLMDSGWQIEKIWVSAFGNVKAVCK